MKNHDIRQKKKNISINGIEIYLPVEEYRYGVRSKPRTPMKCIISNEYANESEAKAYEIYRQRF